MTSFVLVCASPRGCRASKSTFCCINSAVNLPPEYVTTFWCCGALLLVAAPPSASRGRPREAVVASRMSSSEAPSGSSLTRANLRW
eukprot:7390575-Prymnesium_polylepis.1